MVLKVVDEMEKNELKPSLQKNELASYWHQRNDNDSHLNVHEKCSTSAFNFIRALTTPYPGAYVYQESKRIRIIKASISDKNILGTSGKIFYLEGQGPYLVVKEGALLLKDYYFEADKNRRLKHGSIVS